MTATWTYNPNADWTGFGQADNERDLAYQAEIKRIDADPTLSDEAKASRRKEAADAYYKTSSVDLEEFEGLLSRLEGSKKRQQRQKSVEGRRDIYAQGLASMMSNF